MHQGFLRPQLLWFVRRTPWAECAEGEEARPVQAQLTDLSRRGQVSFGRSRTGKGGRWKVRNEVRGPFRLAGGRRLYQTLQVSALLP